MQITFDESSVTFVLEGLGFSVDLDDRSIWRDGKKEKCFSCSKEISTGDIAGVLNLEGAALFCKREECINYLRREVRNK